MVAGKNSDFIPFLILTQANVTPIHGNVITNKTYIIQWDMISAMMIGNAMSIFIP